MDQEDSVTCDWCHEECRGKFSRDSLTLIGTSWACRYCLDAQLSEHSSRVSGSSRTDVWGPSSGDGTRLGARSVRPKVVLGGLVPGPP